MHGTHRAQGLRDIIGQSFLFSPFPPLSFSFSLSLFPYTPPSLSLSSSLHSIIVANALTHSLTHPHIHTQHHRICPLICERQNHEDTCTEMPSSGGKLNQMSHDHQQNMGELPHVEMNTLTHSITPVGRLLISPYTNLTPTKTQASNVYTQSTYIYIHVLY